MIQIYGEGSKLWGVIHVDIDDACDSGLTMWLANDETHLKEQVKEDWVDEEEEDWLREGLEKNFEESWGYSVLPKEIDLSGFIKPWAKL